MARLNVGSPRKWKDMEELRERRDSGSSGREDWLKRYLCWRINREQLAGEYMRREKEIYNYSQPSSMAGSVGKCADI